MASQLGVHLEGVSGEAVIVSPASTASDRVKVLHVVNGDLYAGAERVQYLLAMRIEDYGYQIGFACLKAGRFATHRHCQKTPLFDVAMRSRYDLSPVRRIADTIRSERYQLVHTHSPRAAAVGRMASALAGVPMVHHLHSPAGAEYKQFWRNQFNAAVEWMSLVRVSALIAVSNSVGEHARRAGLPAAKISVVHNGVRTQGPLVDRQPPESTWTLGTAALFRPRKGLEVLIDALARLRGDGMPVRLRAVGAFYNADYEKEIKAQAARLQLEEAIDWVGFSHDVIREMRRMDVFVLPSLFGEGLPMVVLEAMSAGVPVVGTRVEGVPEAIRDEVDGLLADPGDSEALARSLSRVIRGEVDWSALRHSAHRRQAEAFSDVSMTEGVARVYDQVLSR